VVNYDIFCVIISQTNQRASILTGVSSSEESYRSWCQADYALKGFVAVYFMGILKKYRVTQGSRFEAAIRKYDVLAPAHKFLASKRQIAVCLAQSE